MASQNPQVIPKLDASELVATYEKIQQNGYEDK